MPDHLKKQKFVNILVDTLAKQQLDYMMKPRDVQVTKPIGFSFKIDQRGTNHQKELQNKLKKEQEELER